MATGDLKYERRNGGTGKNNLNLRDGIVERHQRAENTQFPELVKDQSITN